MIVFWGFSVPIVAGKMVCFINPLTKLSSPPFWEEYFEIHPLHPSPECSFSISLGRCKCYYDFELLWTSIPLPGKDNWLIDRRDGEQLWLAALGRGKKLPWPPSASSVWKM